MLVRGYRLGSAYLEVFGPLLCHFNLFIGHILAGLGHCLQLVYNIFSISAYVPTTMSHNINSVSKSVKESLVRCSLVLTEVVKMSLSFMLSKLLIICRMETKSFLFRDLRSVRELELLVTKANESDAST